MTAKHEADAPVIAVRNLAAAPPGVKHPAVSGVSFMLRRGEWIAIMGANGSGKTTLALALAGLWPVLAGERTGPGPSGKVRTVTILQEPATQITQRTVRAEIAFTALNLGLGESAADAAAIGWAGRLGLAAVLERAPHELSAGQQQRVLIAAALAAEPDFMIADEAAAHLDLDTRRTVLAILRERVDAGLALIWVTQDRQEVLGADRRFEIRPDGLHEELLPRPPEAGASTAGSGSGSGSIAREAGHGETGREFTTRVDLRILPEFDGRISVAGPVRVAIGDRGVWAIVGPNGTGKTSVLEALAGMEPIRGLEIRWRETFPHGPILAGQFPERQIFEERVRAEVSFAGVRRGVQAGEIERCMREMFDELKLSPDFADRRTWELSTGEKRLVSIVATLLAPTSLLLLDEPTCGLDPARAQTIAGWVRALSERCPVVIATQDQAWIGQVRAIEVPLGICDGRSETVLIENANSWQKNGLTQPCNKA